MVEHKVVAISFSHLIADDRKISAPLAFREFEVEMRGVDVIDLHQLHLLERFHAALHLIGLGGLIPELLNERLCLGNFLLLVLVRPQLLLPAFIAENHILVVFHFIVVDVSAGDLNGAVGHIIYKSTVVADKNDGVSPLGYELLEPLDRTDVEVVGRLVEQQEVRFLKQEFRQLNSHSPSSRELACRSVEVLFSESKSDECPFQLRMIVLPSHQVEAFVLVGEFLHEVHVFLRLIVRPFRQLVVEFLDSELHLADVLERLLRLLHDRTTVGEDHHLRQVSHSDILLSGHHSPGGVLNTGNDFQQCGLSRSVFSHECDSLLRVDDKTDVGEERPSGKLHRKIFY